MVKTFDPSTRVGAVLRDTDLTEYPLAPGALEGSVFRMLRQGQRVVFELDDQGRATRLHLGSEVDMGTPSAPTPLAAAAARQADTRSTPEG